MTDRLLAIKNKSVHPYNKMNLFKIGKTDTKLYCSCQSNEEMLHLFWAGHLLTCLNYKGHFMSIDDSKGI